MREALLAFRTRIRREQLEAFQFDMMYLASLAPFSQAAIDEMETRQRKWQARRTAG
jgi:hypothetical protein